MPESVYADIRHFLSESLSDFYFFYKRFLTHLKYSLNLTQNQLFLKNIGYTCKQSYDELEMSQSDGDEY